MKDLPSIQSLFTTDTQFGGDLTNRKNRGGGTFMDISSITKKHEVQRMATTYKEFEWSKGPILGNRYTIYLETFLPVSILQDFGEIRLGDYNKDLIHLGRMEAMMEWWLTYNELQRLNGRMELIIKTDFYKQIQQLVESKMHDIHDLLVAYHHNLEEYGDYSKEQFRRYVKGHENSSSPFKYDHYDRRLPWKTILNDDKLIQEAWSKLVPKVHTWNTQYDKFTKSHKFKAMIRGDMVYEAGRTRQGDYTVDYIKGNTINLSCEAYVHRTADGFPILSQSEMGIFERKDAKTKVYSPLYDWIKKLIGISSNDNFSTISVDGMQFYERLCTGNWICADLSNAEKTIGNLIWFTPYVGDMLVKGFSRDVARKLISGTGPTKLLADIVVGCVVRELQDDYGLTFNSMACGGDNFALKDSNLLEVYNDLKGQRTFGIEYRCLGFNPDKKRFYPLHFTTDNPKHANNLRHDWTKITQTQSIQYELRPLQTVVQNDLMHTDSAVRFIKWAANKDVFNNAEILNRNKFLELIEQNDETKQSFIDEFSKELEWLKVYIPTHNNPTYPTNLNINPR